jgi:uncharacterized coiled-coil DUF342 family protein
MNSIAIDKGCKDMNKTRVDDMLIEMITPKVKEIEEKFGQNKPLTQEDINTLLLKSQYNHINHLDSKLDEVTADVASLKGEFNDLKVEFTGLKGEFNELKYDLNGRMDRLEMSVKSEILGVKHEISDIRKDFDGLRKDNEGLKKDLELKIAQTINSNMKWSIGLIAFIVAGLKVIDMLLQ